MAQLLQVNNISKSFGVIKAVSNVSFNLNEAEVIAIVGENGAGKSTLIKILSGVIKKDSGEIILNNKIVDFNHPKEALELGISTVYQELSLCPNLTVAENIFVNREPSIYGIINKKELYKKTERILKELDIDIKPDELICNLNLAKKQLVEIIKAFSINAKIIILDEPTSALEISEVKKLFELIKKLKEQKTGIIFISHKMEEIFTISDNIIILRDGVLVNTLKTSSTNQNEVISQMVGRSFNQLYPEKNNKFGKQLFRIENFSAKGKFENISLTLYENEILGLAGLSGAGRTELMQAVFGYIKKDSGKIFIENKEVEILSPKDALNKGIAYSPEDRKEKGLFLNHSIKNNIVAASLKNCSNSFLMNNDKEIELSNEMIKKLLVKTNNIFNPVISLSGGNQQKVLLSKYLLTKPKVFIVDEPTRGIDISSKAEIHKLLRDYANAGNGIIVISSDLMEIIGLCDRVLVFHEGKIKGELKENISEQSIMNLIFNNRD